MHNTNQNKKTVAFVNIEDLNRDPEGVVAAIKAYEEEERAMEEVEADLDESLIALDKYFQPMPRPTPEEIKADPGEGKTLLMMKIPTRELTFSFSSGMLLYIQ